jgi:hypothetical protein
MPRNTFMLTGIYNWLSAPGPSAIALVLLNVKAAASSHILQQLAPTRGTPRHCWLRSPDGEALDEVMYLRENDRILITPHGGSAVRAAFENLLAEQGFTHDPTLLPWQAGDDEVRLLALLPRVKGRLGAELLLSALHSKEARREVEDLPDVGVLFNPPRIQLWGPVNAGKSSLLNALCGRTLAAVADEPGLTRDVIEGRFEHRGLVLSVFDAPGELPGAKGPDADALELAARWKARADLVLRLVPPDANAEPAPGQWLVHSRCDEQQAPASDLRVSVNQPKSLERLKDRLFDHFAGHLKPGPELREALLAWGA